MSINLFRLIQQGEHQEQDFKFCINDSKKIAKSLVAFSNTDGGRLLIGVKDNGKIAGISSDEEFYMIEAAAKLYSKPSINFDTKQHFVDGKTVLEVTINESKSKPHYAKDENGKWLAYYRKDDENKLANKIMLEVWKKKFSDKGILINYSDDEKWLLDYLEETPSISVAKFARAKHIPFRKAEKIIINFIVLDILKIESIDDKIRYTLNEDFDRNEWEINANQ